MIRSRICARSLQRWRVGGGLTNKPIFVRFGLSVTIDRGSSCSLTAPSRWENNIFLLIKNIIPSAASFPTSEELGSCPQRKKSDTHSMNQIKATIAIRPKKPPTTPPIMGARFVLLLLSVCCTTVDCPGDSVVTTVLVTSVTIPFGCVEDDTLVTVLGGGVTTGGFGVPGSTGPGLLIVVHVCPNNVSNRVVKTSTCIVRGTCIVVGPPVCRR